MSVFVVEGKYKKEENGGCGGVKYCSEGEEKRLIDIKVPARG